MCLKGRCGPAGESVEGEKQRVSFVLVVCFFFFLASSAWELCRKVSGRQKVGDSTEEMGVLVAWTDLWQTGKQNPEKAENEKHLWWTTSLHWFPPSFIRADVFSVSMALRWWRPQPRGFVCRVCLSLWFRFEWLIERFIRVCCCRLVRLGVDIPRREADSPPPPPRGPGAVTGSTWRLIGFHCG